MMFQFQITVADGDDFTNTFTSSVIVDADSALDAQLLATQMVTIPMPGKPNHMQVVGIQTRGTG